MAKESGAASSSSSEKSAFILVENLNGNFEWYAFNVSDDVEVNKPPPPLLHYALLGNEGQDFHEDVYFDWGAVGDGVKYKCKGVVKFKPPTATADYERERELGNCWAILGLEDKKKTDIYRICIEDVKSSEAGEAEVKFMGRCCRADVLTSGSDGGSSPTTKTKWESVRPMPNYLSSYLGTHILVLSDKVYCLGCSTEEGTDGKKKRRPQEQSPWAVAHDPRLEEWEYLPDPPRLPRGRVDAIFSAAAMLGPPSTAPSPCILVGLPRQGLIQFYFVDTGKWVEEEFRCCKFFNPEDLCGKAVAVGSTLYWYVVDSKRLAGYDLQTKTWFVGRLAIHDDWGYMADNYGYKNPPPSLAHLGGDMFCLLWVSPLVPVESIDISRIHCMKFRVAAAVAATTNSGLEGGIIPVEATILSCQYHFISGSKTYCDGLVV